MKRWPLTGLLLAAACNRSAPVVAEEVPTPKYQHTDAPAAPPLLPVLWEVVAHGPRRTKGVALTFDACSTRDVSKYDARITAELIDAGTPATIFLGGSWAREEKAHVKELAANPLFELGNHSYTHPHMTKETPQQVHRELLETQAEIFALTGKQPTLFRAPYGEYDNQVVRSAAESGLTTIEYDLASGDPDAHATKERLVEWVVKKAKPGSIIVMHINHKRFHTSEALPGIIAGLRAKGLEPMKVSELIAEAHEEDELTPEDSDGGRGW
jgi:peptidoglycan/xylan/chitin deacetylase (PgdA/CDA1 family)